MYLCVSHIVKSSISSRLVLSKSFGRYSFFDRDMKILYDIVRNILTETTSIIHSQLSAQKYSSESKYMLQVVSCRVFQRKLCDPRGSNRLETKVGDVMELWFRYRAKAFRSHCYCMYRVLFLYAMEQSKVGVATKGKCQQLCFATPR